MASSESTSTADTVPPAKRSLSTHSLISDEEITEVPPTKKSRKATVEDVPDDDDANAGMETLSMAAVAETAEDELGKYMHVNLKHRRLTLGLERLKSAWKSGIYQFFEDPIIVERDGGRRCHVFRCKNRKKNCHVTVNRFTTGSAAKTTTNLKKHAESCWGADVVKKRCDGNSVTPETFSDPSITGFFDRTGNRKPTYALRELTRAQIRYVLTF